MLHEMSSSEERLTRREVRADPEVEYSWREGFHPPRDVEPIDIKKAIYKLKEKTPEALYEASKSSKHVLHKELWSEDDAAWAKRGRMERCRHIMANLMEVRVIGGKTIETRAVEYVRENDGKGKWATIEDIMADQSLLKNYLIGVRRLQEQATAKLQRIEELMS